ncbi:MAG TPA: hypothetical protein VIO94_12885 [Phenylobacterium sp.]
MTFNMSTTQTVAPGKIRRLALIIALALLASNVFTLGAAAELGPMIAALSFVLAPIAALAGLLPGQALSPPVSVEANVIYRPLPAKFARKWMLSVPACWMLCAPLALLTGERGLFLAIGVTLVCLIVTLELLARINMEGASFSVDEGGVYCASTMRRPIPWIAIRSARAIGRGESSAVLIDCAKPADYLQPWLAVLPGARVRLSLADLTAQERKVIRMRILGRLERR